MLLPIGRRGVASRCVGAAVNASLRGVVQRPMKLVECWRWRFRDPASGRVCRTMYAISEEEARRFPQAERVPGTLILREVDEFEEVDFADTLPSVGLPLTK
jgi:hypothetical protein